MQTGSGASQRCAFTGVALSAIAAWMTIGGGGLSSPVLAKAPPAAEHAAPSPASTTKAWRQASVLVLSIDGPLDSSMIATRAATRIREARGAGVEVIVLELNARSWRVDVLHELARVIRPDDLAPHPDVPGGGSSKPSRGTTSFVLLSSVDDRVGSGPAAIGVVADAAYLTPKTRIVHTPADALAPAGAPGADAELAERELRGWMWSSLQDRTGDALATVLLPKPSTTLWLSHEGDATSLLTAPPTGSSAAPIATPETGLTLDAAQAAKLGIISGSARNAQEVLSRHGIRARSLTRESMRSGLSAAREELVGGSREIDEARRKAGGLLDPVVRMRGPENVSKQNAAGTAALELIDRAMARIESLEALTRAYPELLTSAPPGVTDVAQTPQSLEQAWRNFFQLRRTDVQRQRDRALTMTERSPTKP
jgi:hypothetical protein